MNALTADAEASIRLGLFVLAFALLALAELRWPRRQPRPGKARRWLGNLGLSAVNTLAVRLLIPLAGVASALLAEEQGWGLFHLLDWPAWLEMLLFVLVFDLAIYWQHRLYHAVPVLWRFHRVHHTDEDYDLTTGNRFHPVSIVVSALIKIALVLMLGASALAIISAELLLNLTSMFNHSNIRLPTLVDSVLRSLIVTPDMHRIHHSRDRREHNRNFGFNFSFWDRLFASYLESPAGRQEDMPLGIEGFAGQDTRRVGALLLQPFRRS